MRSCTVKENHIGSVVSEILRYRQIDSQDLCKIFSLDEEILVSYNYSLGCAPPWYQQQWIQYLKDRLTKKSMLFIVGGRGGCTKYQFLGEIFIEVKVKNHDFFA